MNLTFLTELDDQQQQSVHDAKELRSVEAKELHVASLGTLLDDGNLVGECLRKSWLRSQGVKTSEINHSNRRMFEGGRVNELIWQDRLSRTLAAGQCLHTEDTEGDNYSTFKYQIPDSEYSITGHADIVVVNGDVPVLGLELKSVSSLWTAVRVTGEEKPDLKHLIQSGLYSYFLGLAYTKSGLPLPYKLCYAQYPVFYAPEYGFLTDRVKGADFIELKKHKGNLIPKNYKPRIKVFDIRVTTEGYVDFRAEGTKTWSNSPVNVHTVLDYVAKLTQPELWKPPLALDCYGEQCSYKSCDYCDLKDLCKQTGSMEELKALAANQYGSLV